MEENVDKLGQLRFMFQAKGDVKELVVVQSDASANLFLHVMGTYFWSYHMWQGQNGEFLEVISSLLEFLLVLGWSTNRRGELILQSELQESAVQYQKK